MKNNLLKYIIILIFSIFHFNLSASPTHYVYNNPVAPKYNFKEVFFSINNEISSNYLLKFYQTNEDKGLNLLTDGNKFSIKSEIIGGECYTGSVTDKKIRYTLKNVSGSAITIVGKYDSGNKIQLLESNLNMGTFSSSTATLNSALPRFLNGQTIPINGEIVFEINLSIPSSDAIQTELTVVYGSSNGAVSISDSNMIEKIVEKNNVYKKPDAPNSLSKQLNQASYYTLATASGLANVEKYKFYDSSNNILSGSLPVKMQNGLIALGTYINGVLTFSNYTSSLNLQYTINNGPCESDKSSYTLRAYTGTIPSSPGSIKGNVPAICYGGTFIVDNQELALLGSEIGYNYILSNYSWEVSYDNGQSWFEPTDNSLTTITGTDPSNFKITLNNLTQNTSVRRKFKPTGSGALEYAYSNVVSVEVIHNKIDFPYDWDVYYVAMGDTFTLPTAITTYPSDVVIRNSANAVVSNNFIAPNIEGEYNFTYTATPKNSVTVAGLSLSCTITRTIKLIVYNTASCNMIKKRTFATIAKPYIKGLIPGGGVVSPQNSVNNNRADYATLSNVVGVASFIGLDLYFTKPDGSLYTGAELRGKKVVVKLGEQYSGLKLAGGMGVKARLTNNGETAASVIAASNTATSFDQYSSNAGQNNAVKGGVLDLLKGDNVFEYSFIPVTSQGAQVDFNGVQIEMGAGVAVADLATVFYAYIEEEVPIDELNNPCNDLTDQIKVTPPSSLQYPILQKGMAVENTNIILNSSIEDVFWGNYTEVLNVASGLSSVTFPYYAVDNNYNSYAIFNTTVGVLNKQFLNVKLRRDARPGDKVQIVLGTEAVNILNLSLLNLSDYKVKFFKGDAMVGEITLDRFKVLDLGLLDFSASQKAIISAPVSGIFDRVQLEQWNTISANLGNQLYVYDVRVNPTSNFPGQTDTKQVNYLCASDFIKIQKSDYCTDYEISFAEATYSNIQLRDELGNLMTDSDGNPIYSISAVTDISNSNLGPPKLIKDNIAYYEVKRLFTEVGNNLLLKIQTKRNGCNYGDPQYLRIRLTNCLDAMINPVIMNSAYN